MSQVVIADQSPMAVAWMEEQIRDLCDMQIVRADSGRALKEAVGADTALVITGLRYEDAPDGEMVTYLLRRGVPTVVMTGDADESRQKALLKQGVRHLFVKDQTSNMESFRQVVREMLEGRPSSVLVVDDSAVSRALLQVQLSQMGMPVLTAADGKTAIELLQSDTSIKAVITDYEMPGMDGLTLVVNIRRRFESRAIGVIALSGTLSEQVEQNFRHAGSTYFMQKPYDIEALKGTIREITRG